jgi:hypothetical protein
MFFQIIAAQFRIAINRTALVAAAFTALVSLLAGISNLDAYASAVILERFVSLIGVVLIASVLSPEQDRRIREVIEAKPFLFYKIISVRLLLASCVCFLIIVVLVFVMLICGCVFPAGEYIFGSFATAFFIGSLGFCVSGISENTVTGYLIAVFYFFTNMMAFPKDSVLYLFSLSDESNVSKLPLFIIACALLGVATLVRAIRAR